MTTTNPPRDPRRFEEAAELVRQAGDKLEEALRKVGDSKGFADKPLLGYADQQLRKLIDAQVDAANALNRAIKACKEYEP